MSSGNSAYSPLPQSNSDTEESSEEELHSSHENHVNKMTVLTSQKPELVANGERNTMNYRPLNCNRDIGIALNGIEKNPNDITILKPDLTTKLSTARKICFGFSICVCIFTVVTFLYLPCNIESCPSVQANVNSWEKTLTDLELHGPISVVSGIMGKSQNLVFLIKSTLYKVPLHSKFPVDGGGIISLLGRNGDISWWSILKRQPKDIDCSLLDIDLDSHNDCLIIGSDSLLKAVQPISGAEIWDVHSLTEKSKKPYNMNFPTVLPDLDGDGVGELVTSCSFGINDKDSVVTSQNHLMLVSGRTGTIIGDPVSVPACSFLRNLVLEKDFSISYTCIAETEEESIQTMSLDELFVKFGSTVSLMKVEQLKPPVLKQHRVDSETTNMFVVNGRRLLLKNDGRCPGDCRVSVIVRDERENKVNETIWSFAGNNIYVMTPVTITFGKLSGFVLKFWQWHQKKGKRQEPCQNFTNSESCSESETGNFRTRKAKGDLNVHRISERVVLITFNDTDSHIVNASQLEITQLCKAPDVCQPELQAQKRSLLIADLDQDQSQELISYTCTYVPGDVQDYNTWQLQSKVRVVRLQAELHKLYEALMRP